MQDIVVRPTGYGMGWKTLVSGSNTDELKSQTPSVGTVSTGTKGVVVIDHPNILGVPVGWWFDMAGAEHFNSYLVPKGAQITKSDDVYYESPVDKAYIEFTFTGSSQQVGYRPQVAVTTAIIVVAIASAIIAIAMSFTLCTIKAFLPEVSEAFRYIPSIITGSGGLFMLVYGIMSGKDYLSILGIPLIGGGGYLAYRESRK